MKKLLSSLIFCIVAVFAVALSACNSACNDDKGGTYYPASSEMKINLENCGYNVVVTTDLGGKGGTYLSAKKDNEFIVFYWLDNGEDCEYFYNLAEENHTNYNSLELIENDEKFGNIVYCGTESAVDDAGIRVVTVRV